METVLTKRGKIHQSTKEEIWESDNMIRQRGVVPVEQCLKELLVKWGQIEMKYWAAEWKRGWGPKINSKQFSSFDIKPGLRPLTAQRWLPRGWTIYAHCWRVSQFSLQWLYSFGLCTVFMSGCVQFSCRTSEVNLRLQPTSQLEAPIPIPVLHSSVDSLHAGTNHYFSYFIWKANHKEPNWWAKSFPIRFTVTAWSPRIQAGSQNGLPDTIQNLWVSTTYVVAICTISSFVHPFISYGEAQYSLGVTPWFCCVRLPAPASTS